MIFECVSHLPSLALVGMAKNVGKTTVLNRLIYENSKQGEAQRRLAITSIGRDGETTDVTTGGEKPRVYALPGTLVATAKVSLQNSDALLEIIDDTPCRTPFGEVMIASVKQAGFVELAGPSTAKELFDLKSQLQAIDPKAMFVVDGALSRLAAAGGEVTAGAVLCTGAAVSTNVEACVDKTLAVAKLLQCQQVERDVLAVLRKRFERAVALQKEQEKFAFTTLDAPTLLGKQEAVTSLISPNTTALLLRGAVTAEVIRPLLASGKLKQKQLVIEDGTRMFLSKEILAQIKRQAIEIRVLHEIELCAVAVNPVVPLKATIDSTLVVEALRPHLNIPIFDVGRSWVS